MTPNEAHALVKAQNWLPMWVVYEKPSDYPNGYVARMHVEGKGATGFTTATIKAETLAEVRKQLPVGLFNLGRDAADDPVILEVWI